MTKIISSENYSQVPVGVQLLFATPLSIKNENRGKVTLINIPNIQNNKSLQSGYYKFISRY